MAHNPCNSDLVWIGTARSYLGLREIAGKKSAPQILKFWQEIAAPFTDDETPWCGAFVGGVLAECDLPIVSKGASAKAWLNLKVALDKPAYGAVVVFNRPPIASNGHVGFIVGKDKNGNLMVLGGNQGNEVSIRPFDRKRVAGYRWPSIYPAECRFNLPLLTSDGKLSQNEV